MIYRCPECGGTTNLKMHVCGWQRIDNKTGTTLGEVLDVTGDGDDPEIFCDDCDWVGLAHEALVKKQKGKEKKHGKK